MSNRRVLQLCADDFGLSEGVDLAILDLIGKGRLSATSCMMAGASLVADAKALLTLADRADIGLHLTFTDLSPLGAMPLFAPDGRPPGLGQLLRAAYMGRLDYREIRAEIGRQIDRFEEIFGRAPDFVDGHQHAHLLPPVRRAIWDAYDSGRLLKSTAIRNCSDDVGAILKRGIEVPKALFIATLSRGLSAAARRRGIPTNDSFRGITAFATDGSFGTTFRRFLTGPGARPLAMCHPGFAGYAPDPTDAIPAARVQEYAYFASDRFADDLEAAGLTIGRHLRV